MYEMHSYLEHILESFHTATGWNIENHYANLTATSRDLLDFSLPSGFTIDISALSSGSTASSCSLTNLSGVVNGSLSYFYCSPQDLLTPMKLQTDKVDLTETFSSFRSLRPVNIPEEAKYREVWRGGRRIDVKNTLLYGKMYLPSNTLEALYIKQFTPSSQIMISSVSDVRLRNGGTMMAQLQKNVGRWCGELIYSTDEALLGLRGLYNFGPDSRSGVSTGQSQLSAGGELYYCAMNKAGGISTGLRYNTLSAYAHTPMTMTLTLNPLMGNLSTTFAVQSTKFTAFASRYDFNVYSYESNLTLGCELWKRPERPISSKRLRSKRRSIQNKDKEQQQATDDSSKSFVDELICKIRVSTNSPGVRLLWEGRVKAFIFSFGTDLELVPGSGIKSFGLELQYAS
ncbi:hypothetical protein V1511DRAFT_505845 [Dipodascopsis uninucleata]